MVNVVEISQNSVSLSKKELVGLFGQPIFLVDSHIPGMFLSYSLLSTLKIFLALIGRPYEMLGN